MAKLAFEPRITRAGNPVPACTFYAFLVVLVNAVAAALKTRKESARIIEMAIQHVAEQLPQRRREELERSTPVKESEKWTRLRFRYTKRDLNALKQAAWSLVVEPAPLGPAMRDAIGAIDMVLGELNAAYNRALPLGDEPREQPKPEALPDLDLPEHEASSGSPANVNYDELIDK